MTTKADGDGLQPMTVARLRRLMTAPTVSHFHGGRARVWVAFQAKTLRDQDRARQDDWSDPAYGATA